MAGHPEATANGLALDRPPEAGDDSGIDFVMAGRNRAARTDPETRPSTSLPLKTDSALGDFTRKLLAPAAAGGFFCGRQGERPMELGQVIWILVVVLIGAAIWYFKGRNRPSG